MDDSTHASSKKGHISAALRELKLSAIQQFILVLVRLTTISEWLAQALIGIRGRCYDVRDILVVLVTDVLH